MIANELRIGNYVLHKGKEYRVDGYDIYKLDESNCDDISEISLTEEWLVKFGFNKKLLKRIGTTDLFLQGEFNSEFNQVYLSTDIGEGKICDPNTMIEGFKYVHQLQNLYFALTGTELTIK